jgi:outer membrane lipoprotein-sorting protein
MDMKHLLCIALLVGGSAFGADQKSDSFQKIKDHLASASCISIGFVSILESDIFKSIDTTVGTAYFSRDGRYFVKLGDDMYLSDNHHRYSYTPANNQVIIQKTDSSGSDAKELFYITRLDEWYETAILTPDKEYKLTRKPGSVGSLPDSLRVTIDKRKGRIARISYFDENDEPVSLVLLQESFPAACDDAQFVPRFPDSVETVKM